MLLYLKISVFSGAQTMIRLINDQTKPRRNKIIKKAIFPIINGTKKGISTAIALAVQPISVVFAKNQNRLDEKRLEKNNGAKKSVSIEELFW